MNYKNISRSFILGSILFICMVVQAPAQTEAAAAPAAGAGTEICHLITSAANMPQTDGFAPPYNLFSAAKELLIQIVCGGSNLQVTVGTNRNNMAVYKQGYVYFSQTWQAIPLTGTSPPESADWIIGSGTASVPTAGLNLPEYNFLLGYACQYVSGQWKCGCMDTACSQPHWQLQIFKSDIPVIVPTPGPGGLIGGGGDLPHKADSLLPECGMGAGTKFYLNGDAAQRASCLNTLVAKGYTHIYLSVANDISNQFGNPESVAAALQEIVAAGIKPVLFTNNAQGSWKNSDMSKIISDIQRLMPVVDPYVSSYNVGFESNEYWSNAEVAEVGKAMRALTTKPISTFEGPGRYSACVGQEWCDYVIYHYGFNKNAGAITSDTRGVISALKKPVVAGFYALDKMNGSRDETLAISLGDAAVAGGASGFAHGGTP